MAVGPNLDARYARLCEGSERPHLAIGGNSHGRKLSGELWSILARGHEGGLYLYLENGRFNNFCQGGVTVPRYENHYLFRQLLDSNANVALLELGGNDLDSPDPVDSRQVMSNLLALFRELESRGKVVYVLSLPFRFTVRNPTVCSVVAYNKKVNYINKRLRYILKGRLIRIPSTLYKESVFHESHGEKVHFMDPHYATTAYECIFHIIRDLNERLSPPGTYRTRLSEEN